MTRPVRPPNQWADAERAFHEAYDVDGTDLPRWDAWYRLRYTVEPGHFARPLFVEVVELVDRLLHRHPEEPSSGDIADIALWPLDADPGDRSPLWFEADGLACAGLPHAGQAIIVGEPVVNGVLCLEVGDRTIWPTYNPQEPVDWKHGWY